jgi:hypothetical protein
MSKLETPMIVAYWKRVGGTLLEDFQLVKRSALCGPRRADAVIVLNGECCRIPPGKRTVDIAGKDVIVVQAKKKRLSMYLMGQAVFSAELMKRFRPKSTKSVILCEKDDAVLRLLLARFRNVEVVPMDGVARLEVKPDRRIEA